MYPLIIKPAAEEDIRQSVSWYNERSRKLGKAFLERLESVFQRIRTSPEIHAKVYRDVRLTLLRRFPYVVCYLFENETVYVLAVFHGRRDPSVWQERIE